VRTNQVSLLCNSIEELSPANGGQHGRQLRVGLSMDADQIRAAIVNLLGDMPENEAFGLLFSEFPEWFTEVEA
jgi:hypothetical protein